ncbi:MAG: hypothetical protein JWN51_1483 [Phycisphaerales bacterium]|nr:hypothetical protein [Phycisphaerales bacterium]
MLQELNNESVLLMYLADELPHDDRAEVEQMLAGDPTLRAQLALLEQAQDLFETGMGRLDAAQPLAGEPAAVRRITAAMRRNMLEYAAAAPAPVVMRRGLRYPWWAYPTVAAASVLLAFLTWWGHVDSGPMNLPAPPNQNSYVEGHDESAKQAEEMARSFETVNPTQPEQGLAMLDTTEREIAELSQTRVDQVQAYPGLDVPNE